jgi:hypothetical protein
MLITLDASKRAAEKTFNRGIIAISRYSSKANSHLRSEAVRPSAV